VYTSETRKYDYEKRKVNFGKQEIMLKDLCRNEESTVLRLQLFEFMNIVVDPKDPKYLEALKKEEERRKKMEEKEEDDDEYGEEDEEPEEEQDEDMKKMNTKNRGAANPAFEHQYLLISEVFFRINEVYNPRDKENVKRRFEFMDLENPRERKAVLLILRCAFLDRFTFLDYIHGGCEISTIIGMDFTLSNKPSTNPKSLHYLNPDLAQYYQM